jgi:hypothetical protein
MLFVQRFQPRLRDMGVNLRSGKVGVADLSYHKEALVIVYHAKEFESAVPRAHPWSSALANESHVYIDFKANPKLIRSAIEDLRSYADEPFAEEFYSLIEWLNGKESLLETNDCAFSGAIRNIDSQFPFKHRCSGRLMILFRNITENAQPRSVDWLINNIHDSLMIANPSFKAGAVGISRMAAVYKALSPEPRKGGLGSQVMLSFFAYGKNDDRCYESMYRILRCTHTCLVKVNRQIKNGALDALYG